MTRSSETKQIRRVITGHANGKSVIKSDEVLSTYHFKAVPGFEHTMIWASNGIPNLSDEPKADYPSSVIPAPGATNIQVVLFPGGYPAGPALQSAVIDREAAAREYLERLPGLAETFERDQPAKLRKVIEGLALQRPPLPLAAEYRRVQRFAQELDERLRATEPSST
jgi:hypothetical protein